MVSFLAFDNRSIKELLGVHNKRYFNKQYPIFYKNENQRSDIDKALDNN